MEFADIFAKGDWLDEKPDPGLCQQCGADVEPFKHPSSEQWLKPADRCEPCEERLEHQRTEAKNRVEAFERHWHSCGVSRRKRVMFGNEATGEDPVEDYQTLRRDHLELHPELDPLIAIPPDRSDDRLDCGAYIHGPTGSGKTTQGMLAVRRYLSTWILNADRRQHPTAKYVDTLDLVERLKGCYGGEGNAEQVIRGYLDADFLVVDELGKERATANTAQTMTRLINHRAEQLLPTIWISNFGLDRLSDESDVYEGRTRWRILEMCGGSDGNFRRIHLTENKRDPRHRPGGSKS